MIKEAVVCEGLMPGGNYNQFEAANRLYEDCIHSMAVNLERNHLVMISQVSETTRVCIGKPTHACGYWVDQKERTRIIGRKEQAIKKVPTLPTKIKNAAVNLLINPSDELGLISR